MRRLLLNFNSRSFDWKEYQFTSEFCVINEILVQFQSKIRANFGDDPHL